MRFTDILSLAFRSLRANRLRSGITVAIIALGITALIGIITAIGAMNQKITESFSTIGAAGFTIRFKERGFRIGNNREIDVQAKGRKQEKKSNLGKRISLTEAERFTEAFQYPALVSIAGYGGNNNTVSTKSKKTSPVVTLFGTDEAYLSVNGFSLQVGRNLSAAEVQSAQPACLLGYDAAVTLFGDDVAAALNKEVRINNVPMRVIGVLKAKGSVFGFSRDNTALTGYKNFARAFQTGSFTIGVKTEALTRVEDAMGEAEGTFRAVRGLAVTEQSNFAMERSNSVAEKAITSLRYLTIAVTLIGLITLIGAAIGLMNIMLVAVAERTKEIGLAKAIGATASSVHKQFLAEAVIISIAGAVVGIAVGIGLGNLFGLLLQTDFIVPWNWVAYGIVICTVTGLLAGLYPAVKAARLNPIQALRYE